MRDAEVMAEVRCDGGAQRSRFAQAQIVQHHMGRKTMKMRGDFPDVQIVDVFDGGKFCHQRRFNFFQIEVIGFAFQQNQAGITQQSDRPMADDQCNDEAQHRVNQGPSRIRQHDGPDHNYN